MADNTQSTGGGIGCFTVLGLIFITLKLTHNIDWSWLWVLAPFWMPISIVLACLLIWFIAYMIHALWPRRT